MDENNKTDHWGVDKRVPIALIIAIVIQTLGAVWWAAQMDSRVHTLETLATKNSSVESRLARIEEGQSWLKETLTRINQKLDK